MRYNNYHKHTTKSSVFSPDTHIQMEEYFKRAKELGHNTYFTTEHGFGGDIFEALSLSNKEEYKDIKIIFALEGYIVPNPLEKDNSNYHIMLIAKTDTARKKLNKINSRANKDGYYYRPRIFLEDLLKIDKEDIYITTSCVAGIIRDEIGFKEIFLPLHNHFGQSLMVETQTHNEDVQKRHNKNALAIADKYDLKLIHANDSHYIYPKQSVDRLEYLKGKGITYGDEDNFILDYPDYNTILERYQKQGILTEQQAKQAIKNTLIFDNCENLQMDTSIKMPNIYPNLTPKERFEKLRQLIYKKWLDESKNIPVEKHKEYQDAIKFELDIIKNTNEVVHTADYFLLNEKIIDIAVNEYGGRLTKTGRGSGSSFYINKLLGLTGMDRLALNVPMYPTRFISESRLLETRSIPDFDFNTANPEPFIKASRDLLGNNGCYWMIAYGTMKESEAFRNTCRDMGLEYDKYNEIAKNLDGYRNDKYWGEIIKHSKRFVDSVVSVSPHPCANLLLDKDIEEELGVIRIKDKICATITSKEADDWKFLKNDYLTVLVVEIIYDTFDLIGKEVLSVSELINSLDSHVWDLYKNGITTTLNQTDSDFATNLVKKYAPTKYEELSSFVAAIRPGFASLLNIFINREPYSNGVEALDNLFKTTNNFMLYQENVMEYLVWLGVPEDITYEIVKKIAKKSFAKEEIEELHSRLMEMWKEKIGTEKGFIESWQVIENNVFYSFNASHSISVALDSLYGAYLKVNYPYEYYKVVLDKYKDDLDRTNKLINELKYFNIHIKPIKFRHSKGEYTINKTENAIYKGISSIKYISSQLGEELYQLKDNHYPTFLDLLKDIKEKTSCNTRQLEVLIRLDFFEEFGEASMLLQIVELYNWTSRKQISKKNIDKTPFTMELLQKYSQSETDKTFKDIDFEAMINDMVTKLKPKPISIQEKIKFQQEYLGYIDLSLGVDGQNCYVVKTDTKFKPRITVVSLNNSKQLEFRMAKKYYSLLRIKKGDLIYIHQAIKKPRWRKAGEYKNGKPKFEIIPGEFEWEITNCEKILEEDIYTDRSESNIS